MTIDTWVDMLSCFGATCNHLTRAIASDPSNCVRRPLTRPGTTPLNTTCQDWYNASCKPCIRPIGLRGLSMLSCFVTVSYRLQYCYKKIESDRLDNLDWVELRRMPLIFVF
jgi:hypothetical protein